VSQKTTEQTGEEIIRAGFARAKARGAEACHGHHRAEGNSLARE
jgi:hypothetical protein